MTNWSFLINLSVYLLIFWFVLPAGKWPIDPSEGATCPVRSGYAPKLGDWRVDGVLVDVNPPGRYDEYGFGL